MITAAIDNRAMITRIRINVIKHERVFLVSENDDVVSLTV